MIPLSDELTRVAWAHVWQVTLLIAAVAVVTRLLASNRPHLAHALWLVVLVKLLTPPVLCSSGGVFCWMQATFEEEPTESIEQIEHKEPLPVVAEMSLPPLPSNWEPAPPVELVRTEAARRPVAVVPAVVIETVEPARRRFPSILLGVWLFGTLAALGVSGTRLAICLRRVRRNALPVDESYRRMLDRLTGRLRLRRRVRLLITSSRIGPAVVGLLRPTVLLPEVVVRGKTPDELEPILAHELLHVRRGDLWVGALQAAARCVWWFHPLTWSVDRLISREAERCCDEAVLAELGCTPSRYARSLFDVLERKQILKPLPAFPGVRPVEVTSRRLERIMRLGHGSHKRSPWWCWVVMLLAAAVTLPGAALVVGADERAEPEVKSADVAPSPAANVISVDSPSERLQQRSYHIDKLLAAARAELGLNQQEAKQLLLRQVANLAFPADSKRTVRWGGSDMLVVRDTLGGHNSISAQIDVWRRYDARHQVTFETQWITAPVCVFKELQIDLPVTFYRAVEFNTTMRVDEQRTPVPFGVAVADPDQSLAVMSEHLDWLGRFLLAPDAAELQGGGDFRQAVQKLLGREDRPAIAEHTHGAPIREINMFCGETGVISNSGVSVTTVYGKTRDTAAARVPEDDLRLFLYPRSLPNGRVQFGCRLELPSDFGEGSEVDTDVELSADQTLLIHAIGKEPIDAHGAKQAMLLMVRPTRVSSFPDSIAQEIDRKSHYYVGDLIAPFPVEVVASSNVTEWDYDSLIAFIKIRVDREGWDTAGGRATIAPSPSDQSLVIGQTSFAHVWIRDLLEQLRHRRDHQLGLVPERPPAAAVQPVPAKDAENRIYFVEGSAEMRAGEESKIEAIGAKALSSEALGNLRRITLQAHATGGRIAEILVELRSDQGEYSISLAEYPDFRAKASAEQAEKLLAMRRAVGIMELLTQMGVKKSRIFVGISVDKAPSDVDPDGKKLGIDDRVEVYLVEDDLPQSPTPEPSLTTRVYKVADLITPHPRKIVDSAGVREQIRGEGEQRQGDDEQKRVALPAVAVPPRTKQEPEEQDLNSLVDLLATVVFPETWDEVGGPGRIAPDLKSKSLVITQTNEAHEEIIDLLEQLRDMGNLQVHLDVEFMHVPLEFVEAIGAEASPPNDDVTLSPREARLLRAFVEKSNEAGIRTLADLDVYNGQQVQLTVSPVSEDSPTENKTVWAQAVVDTNKDQIHLTLALPSDERPGPPGESRGVSLERGRAALIDVTEQFPPELWVTGLPSTSVGEGVRWSRQEPNDWENYRTFVWENYRTFILVTPRRIAQVEEEQRLGSVVP